MAMRRGTDLTGRRAVVTGATDDARFITGQGIMVDGGVMVHS